MKVAIFDRDADRGEKVAGEIGGVYCQVDVTSDEAVDAGFAKARAAHGQERICVNCAGVANAVKTVGRDKATGEIRRYPVHQFELAIQINLIGTFRVLAASAAGMATLEPLEDGERGVIVNTASVAAQDGQIGQAAYAASKAGVLGMALPIARDLMGEGIRVNTILPGVFETPMVAMMPQNVKDALAAQVPFPEAARPGRGICAAGRVHGRERLSQRRICPLRRRHTDGAALNRTPLKIRGFAPPDHGLCGVVVPALVAEIRMAAASTAMITSAGSIIGIVKRVAVLRSRRRCGLRQTRARRIGPERASLDIEKASDGCDQRLRSKRI